MTGRRWFWLGLAAGTPLMAIGVWGIFRDAAVTSPFNFALWFIGGNLVHDFLLAPAVFIIGFVLRRRVPGRHLGRVQWGLALSGIVLLFAAIPLLALGKSRLEPTVQPLPQPTTSAVFARGFMQRGICAIIVWLMRSP